MVPRGYRELLHEAVRAGAMTAIWSPWIIAELNRVLVWRWIERTGGDYSRQNQERCSVAAARMMSILLPAFELVAPLPPYPPAWATLTDPSDQPIWAAAKTSGAAFVVSENRRDFPPADQGGRHIHEGIEFLAAEAFLARLSSGADSL